ncbi:GNAT family N-acetyltransferase [Loktanella fryxellensis]|uniref:GNAT family N-acetyltransferase n=1 Tax=Loktanella fryxellensis TaxID=245187 RepID=UPI0015A68447|nr:GNAT family N-acetyltransferase [Loktanella fryxellensis]
MIRQAAPDDAAALADLWNPVIRDTTITFNPVPKSPDDVARMIADRTAAGHGFLVATVATQVAGFATYGQFRGGDGYRHTGEHTVILGPAARGQGVGRAVMEALCAHARTAGMHSLFAGCSAENPGAIAFHTAIGFRPVAVLPQVGRKFDRWIDLHLLQKML